LLCNIHFNKYNILLLTTDLMRVTIIVSNLGIIELFCGENVKVKKDEKVYYKSCQRKPIISLFINKKRY
jgi:hypothetical protein